MPPTPLAEQASGLITSSFKDGVASDGAPTEEEVAAAAADTPKTPVEGGQEDGGVPVGDEDGEDGEDGGEDGEDGEGKSDEEKPKGDAKPKDGEEKPPAKAPKKSAADRIGDLTAARRTAERLADSEKGRADRLQAELDAIKSGKTPLTGAQSDDKSDPASPDPSQFDYGELDPKYIAALARHETAKALKAAKADDEKERQTQAADAKRQELGEKQDALVKAGVKLHDDFDEVVMQGARDGKWDLSTHLGELLLDSEFGAEIAYELAKDPDEAARVAKLSATDQAKFLGRQEAKFEAAKSSQGKQPPKTPQAPPPPKTPRGNSGSLKTGADSRDFAAVEAAWKSGQLK
jgi:hypothetical protein